MSTTPSTPTTDRLTGDWHKVVALLMHKLKVENITITAMDIALMPEGLAITAQDVEDGLELRLVDLTTAREFACSQQGDLL